ncbi:MAG: signal peptidase II [bacterium]
MAGLVKKALALPWLLAVFLAVDRLAKFFSLKKLPLEGVSLIPGWLNFSLYRNSYIAFGWHLPEPLLLGLIIIILFGLGWLFIRAYQHQDFGLAFWLGLVIVGALSNLIDRLIYGQVIDFIEVPGWSVFNFADIFIIAGLLGWLVRKVKIKN